MKNRKTGCKRTRKSGALLPVFCLSASLLLSGCGQADETEAYVRGIGALRNNDYASAIANFETAVKDGREAEGYRGIGIADMYLGEYEKAEDFFSKALNAVVHPDQNRQFMEDVLYYQAQAYVLQEKYEDASTIYNQLLEGKNPGQAYLLRGKIYAAQNKFGQAGQDFQKAVERNPSYEYYLEIYDVYVKNNRQADGAAFLQEAQRRSPSSGEDYYQLGRISYELGDYDQAEIHLKKAVSEGISGAVQLLGKVYMDAGKKDQARKMYEQCITDKTAPGAGYNGLALCDMENGDYDSALKNVTKGLSEKDSREELLFNEIVIYEHKYDFATAAEKMKLFLSAYPMNKAAIRENLFLESRVKETQGKAHSAAEGSEAVTADSAQVQAGAEDAAGTAPATFADEDNDGIPDDETQSATDGVYYNGEEQEAYTNGYDSSDW